MDVDLLKGSDRPLWSRVFLAQETWIALAILVIGLVVSVISAKFATSETSSTFSRMPASSGLWRSA